MKTSTDLPTAPRPTARAGLPLRRRGATVRARALPVLALPVLALAGTLLALGCAGAPAAVAPPPRDAAEVSILIYSGRENPRFRLDDAALARLAELLRAARPNPSFRGQSVIPARLGYQGLRLVNAGHLADLPSELLVHDEDIELVGAPTRFLSDPGGNIQRLLLDEALAKKAITQDIYDRIRG